MLSPFALENTMKAIAALILIPIWVALLWGWVLNILALVAAPSLGGLELLRAVGVFFAPLGSILGLFA